MDRIMDFMSGQDRIQIHFAPCGADGVNYAELDLPGAGFADVYGAAKGIIEAGMVYAFVADGENGFLFADSNRDGEIDIASSSPRFTTLRCSLRAT